LNQVCLIRETKNTRSVGVPPGTGLGNTELEHAILSAFLYFITESEKAKAWTRRGDLLWSLSRRLH